MLLYCIITLLLNENMQYFKVAICDGLGLACHLLFISIFLLTFFCSLVPTKERVTLPGVPAMQHLLQQLLLSPIYMAITQWP